MTSVFAIVRRILTQFALDKRTLALLFVAPLVVLWLLSVILGADTVGPKIATVDLPAEFQAQLEQTDARITETDADEASALLADNNVAAVLSMEGEHTLKVELEGTDSTKSAAVLAVCAEALGELRGDAAEEMEAAGVEFHEADRQAFLDMGCGDLVLKYSIGQELLDTLAEIRSK